MSDTPRTIVPSPFNQEPTALVDSALQVYARTGMYPDSRELHEAAMAYRAELIRIVTANAKYGELLFAVERVFEGETRHETALRYIRETEAHCCTGPSQEATL